MEKIISITEGKRKRLQELLVLPVKGCESNLPSVHTNSVSQETYSNFIFPLQRTVKQETLNTYKVLNFTIREVEDL